LRKLELADDKNNQSTSAGRMCLFLSITYRFHVSIIVATSSQLVSSEMQAEKRWDA